MPFSLRLTRVSSGHDVFLKNSNETVTRPKFSLLLMGGDCEGFSAHFWGQKMIFCPNFAPVDLYIWSSIDIMMLGPHAIPPSCSSLPLFHFIINHGQSSSLPCPSAAHVGIVLVLHAKCCSMAHSKFILMHGNCSHAWVIDVCAVLGHYSSTMWSVAATRVAGTMVCGHVPKKGGDK